MTIAELLGKVKKRKDEVVAEVQNRLTQPFPKQVVVEPKSFTGRLATGFSNLGAWRNVLENNQLNEIPHAFKTQGPATTKQRVGNAALDIASNVLKVGQGGYDISSGLGLGQRAVGNKNVRTNKIRLARGGVNVIEGAPTVAGGARPLGALGYSAFAGGIGAVGSKLQGNTNRQALQAGLNTAVEFAPKALAMGGITRVTSPAINTLTKGIGNALVRLPIKSGLNITEGLAIDRAIDSPTTKTSILIDALFPVAGDLAPKVFKSADEAMRSVYADVLGAFGKKLRNNKGAYTTAKKFVNRTRAYNKTGRYSVGAFMGFEPYQDEQGNWRVRFNDKKALAGIGLMLGGTKAVDTLGKVVDDVPLNKIKIKPQQTVDPLIQEARKYKSAENEFNILSNKARRAYEAYWKKNPFATQSVENNAEASFLLPKEQQRLQQLAHDMSVSRDKLRGINTIQDIKDIVHLQRNLRRIGISFDEKASKSQLTDIWNKANATPLGKMPQTAESPLMLPPGQPKPTKTMSPAEAKAYFKSTGRVRNFVKIVPNNKEALGVPPGGMGKYKLYEEGNPVTEAQMGNEWMSRVKKETTPNPVPPPYVANKSKIMGGIRKLVTSGESILNKSGEGGKKLARAIESQRKAEDLMRGQWDVRIDNALRGLSDKELGNVDALLRGETSAPISDNASKAAKELRKFFNEIGTKAEGMGFQIETKAGTKTPFKMRTDYAPQMYRPDEFKDAARRDQALRHLIATGQARNLAEATRLLDDFIITNSERRFGNLEKAREIQLPGFIRDPRIYVKKYAESIARRFSQVEHFGMKDSKVASYIDQIAQDGGDYKEAQRIFDYVTKGAPTNKAVNAITQYNLATQLDLAAITNSTQIINTAAKAGIRNTIKGVVKSFTKEGKQVATGAGVYDKMVNIQEEGVQLNKIVEAIMWPFQKVENFNRRASANAGAIQAEQLAKGEMTDYAIRELKSLGIDPASIVDGKLSKEQLASAAWEMARRTQFKVSAYDVPPSWKTPLGRLVTQYQSFSFMQTKFIRDEILKEAAKGNYAPLVRFIPLAITASYISGYIRNLVTGRDPKEQNKSMDIRAWDKWGKAFGDFATNKIIQAKYVADTFNNPYNTPLKKVTTVASSVGGATVGKVGQVLTGLENMQSGFEKNKNNAMAIAKGTKKSVDPYLDMERFVAGEVPFVGEIAKNTLFPYPKSQYTDAQKLDFANQEAIDNVKIEVLKSNKEQDFLGRKYYPSTAFNKETGQYEPTVKSVPSSQSPKAIYEQLPKEYEESSDAPKNILQKVAVYGAGFFTDRDGTLNALKTGQPIRKLNGDAVVVERLKGLSALDAGDKATQVDHIIAVALGGDNSESNLRPIPVNENQAKALVDTYLLGLLKSGEISKAEAQQRDLNWKNEFGNLDAQDKARFLNLMKEESEPEKVSNDILKDLSSRTYKPIKDKTTGNYSAPIELKLPATVKTTGYSALDKENESKYSGALTTFKNNIGKLYLDGQITAQEANDAIVKIKDMQKGTQKSASSNNKKIKISAPPKIKVTATKRKATPLKIKRSTSGKIKLTLPAMVSPTPKRTAKKIDVRSIAKAFEKFA